MVDNLEIKKKKRNKIKAFLEIPYLYPPKESLLAYIRSAVTQAPKTFLRKLAREKDARMEKLPDASARARKENIGYQISLAANNSALRAQRRGREG